MISAAPVGVGARTSAAWSISRRIRLVADRRDKRDGALRGGADHGLVVEAPEILEAAAAARHDEHVRSRDAGGGESALKPGCRLQLRPGSSRPAPAPPDQHMQREAVGDAVDDVADHRAGRRVVRRRRPAHRRQQLLAGRVEQALGREPAAALLELGLQRADAGGLQALDDELVLGRAGKVETLPEAISSSPSSGRTRMRPKTPFHITASILAERSLRPK